MRVRLDSQLVARGLAASREKAQRLVLAGAVRVNGQLADKCSALVTNESNLTVAERERYASRGGYKLEAAFPAFQIDCTGSVCVDIGASTGGFTDCLLQHGARRVYAVDVGKGQLDWALRQDPRVVVIDGMNARNITRDDIGESADLITIDVSFISLKKILPAACQLLKASGRIIALIKPQFEAGRTLVKKGVVRDAHVHETIKSELQAFATAELGLKILGVMDSPLLGPAGNKEFLIGLEKQ